METYIPHPAPEETGAENHKMGFLGVFETLTITATISLLFYLIVSFILKPIWRRYYGRYARYLPLDRASTQMHSLQQRVQVALIKFITTSLWKCRFLRSGQFSSRDDEIDFDDDVGQELYEVDNRRREALSLDYRRGCSDVQMRLSRDLEEGFKDDSEESDNED
ncbi:putative checkpoint protein hus1 protein [Golovinomyces cichoracearum]|uniref:Putative checkpoint protein hus1 protein n=1 Tax=Golovinomyces cichoracearum TaxID=62708 RepID=A0A420HBC3_9PEZI|nr:putative checkpoint protein hus1 protein [Golovinomyces cichoracearum]